MAEQTAPVRRRVAVKILKAGMDTRQIIARFEAERQALAMMDHPNIARILDGGETGQGRPFFVMELVRGIPITTYCDGENLDPEQRLRLFIKVCRAVQHAHQKGIIHRDLKPGNILVTVEDGAEPVPKVIDFGVAKATEARLTDKTMYTRFEQMIGTPAYMSPEQAGAGAAHDIDTRSDIYALGVLLYELLTGTTPIEAETLRRAAFDEVRRILREEEAPRPSARLSSLELDRRTTIARHRATESATLGRKLRGDLDWIIMKAIEKDRRRRYDTANDLAADVDRHLGNIPVLAVAPSARYRLGKFARRYRAALGVAAAMGLLLVAGIAASTWQAVRATAEKRRAVEAEALAEQRRAEAEAISSFLTGMFENAKPGEENGGRTITVAETLKAAVAKLATDRELPQERRAVLQKAIGEVYHSLGLLNEAIELQEQVRQYYVETHGLEHPDTLKAILHLASSYFSADRRDEGLKKGEEVLALCRKVLGPEHPDTLYALLFLATIHFDKGDANLKEKEEALKSNAKLLEICRRVFGAEHRNTIEAMSNLAHSYSYLDRKDDALKLHEEVLELRRKIHGEEHPSTIVAMVILADSMRNAGEGVLEMDERILSLSRKVLGPEHDTTIRATLALGNSYSDAGRFDEALEMQEELLTLSRNVRGPEHPFTLSVMSNLAEIYVRAGRNEKGLEMHEEVLALRSRTLGDEDAATIYTKVELAACYGKCGRKDEALKLLEEVLPLCRKMLGPGHLHTRYAMWHMAEFRLAIGRKKEGLEMYEELLEVQRKVRGADHLETLNTMHALATNYTDAEVGRMDEGLKLSEELLALRTRLLGPGHRDTSWARLVLSTYYEDAGRLDEALALVGHLSLRADSPAAATVLIPPTSEWRWLHPVDGIDPAEADPDFHRRFPQVDFDDSGWRQGMDSEGPTGGFGYGDEGFTGVDIGTPAEKALGKSAYFRHRFRTEKEFTGLELRCRRDDGIIVYLDGKEVVRDNMKSGEEAYRLHAEWTINGAAEAEVFRFPLGDLILPAGDHVLAISLHNTESPSSDLSIGGITLIEVE